eukprot:CAMPEP_0197297836 /NCGR_PEP_ID=MMETSP0890-20130614/42123_1 /TAXON_ID=44058 ORGANISM="Aureoumbra lagunensis, Strain CCMP1510" /NCGR_SAMPLE_ID=MMETSP0890 /ASSEMBLY_ACC=CAM_ASM_000533 /LENGTH=585 /DNA_ID=CAMNT_0042775221 /DNA_START=58 /DNA_END=1815 /DNA_ORIENTATION=+
MVFSPWRRAKEVTPPQKDSVSENTGRDNFINRLLPNKATQDEVEILKAQIEALRKEVEVAEIEEAKWQNQNVEEEALRKELEAGPTLFATAAAAAAAVTMNTPENIEKEAIKLDENEKEVQVGEKRWTRSKDERLLLTRERSLSWCQDDTVQVPNAVRLAFVDAIALNNKEEWFLERLEVGENGRLDFLCSPKLLSLLLTIPASSPSRGWLAKSVDRIQNDCLFVDILGTDDFDPYYEIAKTPLASVFIDSDQGKDTSTEKWLSPGSMLASRCGLSIGPDSSTEKARQELSERLDLCGRALWRRWRNAVIVHRRPLAELELAALGLAELARNVHLNDGTVLKQDPVLKVDPLSKADALVQSIATECRASIEAKLFGAAAQLTEDNFETEYVADRRVFRDDISDQAKLDAVRLAHRSVRATAAALLLAIDNFLYDRDRKKIFNESPSPNTVRDLESLFYNSNPRLNQLMKSQTTDSVDAQQLEILNAYPNLKRLIALEAAASWISNLIIFGSLAQSILSSALLIAVFIFVFNYAHPFTDAIGSAFKPAFDAVFPHTGPNDVSTGYSELDRIIFPDDYNNEGWWTRI